MRVAKPLQTLSVQLSETVSANRFLSLALGVPSQVGDTVYGVTLQGGIAGDVIPLGIGGTAIVEAGAAIAPGALITWSNDGRAIAGQSTNLAGILAPGEEATAAGKLIEIILFDSIINNEQLKKTVATHTNITGITLDRLARAVPSALPTLPMQLIGMDNGIISCVPDDAVSAAKKYHAALFNDAVYYIKPDTGSDSNSGLTTSAPFATVAKFLRTATGARSIGKMLCDCVIPGLDLRYNDASQATQQIKILDGNGFNVTIREASPDLAALTWSQDGTYTNCWTSTLSLTGAATINSVLDSSVLDDFGKASELTKFTSLVLLNAATVPGYYFASNSLSINDDAKNIQQLRRNYRCLCMNTAGNARIYIAGAILILDGINGEGIYFEFAEGNSRRPEAWLHNCTFIWAPSKTGNMTVAGWMILSDSQILYGAGDGINAFQPSVTGQGLIQSVRSKIYNSGNRRIYTANGTLQSVSAHTGSHHVGFGSTFGGKYNNGACITDVGSTAGENDITWLVACQFDRPSDNFSSLQFSAGGTGMRTAFIDSCDFHGYGLAALEIITGATVYAYNTDIPIVSGGTVLSYSPNLPA